MAALVLALLASAPLLAEDGAEPVERPKQRPLRPAEVAAVELAVSYLAGGDAEVLWQALAAEAPLRGLGHDDAVAEMRVRTGPAEGATWTLATPAPAHAETEVMFVVEMPSGFEDTLTFEMVEEGGRWRIGALRCLADPYRRDKPSLTASPAAASGRWMPRSALALAGLLAALALVVASIAPRPRRTGPASAAALSLLALLACRGGGAGEGETAAGPDGPLRLAALQPLRWAIAGLGTGGVAKVSGAGGALSEVSRLWQAAASILDGDLAAAENALAPLAASAEIPLAGILKARLAKEHLDGETAVKAYDDTLATGVDHDLLRLEAIEAALLAGAEDHAEREAMAVAGMGSRLAEAWYLKARFRLVAEDEDGAEAAFRTAWALEPMVRAEILDDVLLATTAARGTLFSLLDYENPEEPAVASPEMAAAPIALPAGARAWLTGELFEVATPAGRLRIPGGGRLASAETPVESAAARRTRLEQEVMGDLETIARELAAGEAVGQPRLRRRSEMAAVALARQNRWSDLLTLTDGVPGRVDQVRPMVVQLRALALRRAEREEEARRLLIELATDEKASKRRDVSTYFQLAELCAAAQEYDLASRLLRKVDALTRQDLTEQRQRQIALDAELAGSYAQLETDHFVLRYPRTATAELGEQLGAILEAEWQRLQRWIPVERVSKVEVHLFPLEQFLSAFSGGVSVIGIYDGRVRVPFAAIREYHPILISILSHELAHAMIARRTHDQAPHWLQEGLAQHVQMVQESFNPFPDLAASQRLVAFSHVEPILSGFAEAQLVELAYQQSAWMMRYVETKHGVAAIHRLMDAYAAGKVTDDALRGAVGMDERELGRAAWKWAVEKAPKSWPAPTVRRYDREFDRLVRRVNPAAPKEPSPLGTRPRVGLRQEVTKEAMAAWHAGYLAAATPAKRALGQALDVVRGRKADGGASCRQLADAVRPLLVRGGALEAPDPKVATPLRAAYEGFHSLALACVNGHQTEAQLKLREAEKQLGLAAAAMKKHGAAP